MKRLTRWTIALVGTLASACDHAPLLTAPSTLADDRMTTAKPRTLVPVSLIVTVGSTDPLGNTYGIRDDGQGDYIDGSQSVQAVLDQYGTFAFNTDNSSHAVAVRWVQYDFGNPVDLANTYRPSPSTTENFHFSTGASSYSPFIPIQDLGVNGNPSSECAYMGNGLSNRTTAWRVSFHAGVEDTPTSPTAFAVITRTSVTPAMWTITPSGACSPNSNVAALRSSDSSVLYGYYRLPFFFTLRTK